MATADLVPRLSDEQLTEMLSLIKGADSVELKLTVPVSDRSRAPRRSGWIHSRAQIRQVYFFDTPDLALNKAGVVVRARRVQRKGDDSVVKLRPVVPEELPAELRRSPNFGVEVDAMPGGFVCSGSMKRALGRTGRQDAVMGERPVRKLFSKEQRALYAAHAPDGPRARRPRDPGPDLRAQAEVRAQGLRSQARGRDVAVPGQLHDPRAVDEVRAGGGLPGRRRDQGVPDAARHRPERRAGDEDEEGARVLLQRLQAEAAEQPTSE